MEKTLNFTDNGKEYRLTFTRETVVMTENMGFNINAVYEKPIFSLQTLWRGAFLANHDTLTIAEIDELFEKVKKKGLLDALIDLYTAPVDTLFEETEDNSKNAIAWAVN